MSEPQLARYSEWASFYQFPEAPGPDDREIEAVVPPILAPVVPAEEKIECILCERQFRHERVGDSVVLECFDCGGCCFEVEV